MAILSCKVVKGAKIGYGRVCSKTLTVNTDIIKHKQLEYIANAPVKPIFHNASACSALVICNKLYIQPDD